MKAIETETIKNEQDGKCGIEKYNNWNKKFIPADLTWKRKESVNMKMDPKRLCNLKNRDQKEQRKPNRALEKHGTWLSTPIYP